MKSVALALVLVGLALPFAARADVGDRSAIEIEVDALTNAIARGDCGEGLSMARRITQRGVFKGLRDESRGAIWTFAAVCADRKGLYAEALEDARQATATPGATAGVWAMRLRAAVKAKQLDDVPAAVETLAKGGPAALNALPVSSFRQFKSDALAAGRADLATRVYATLEASGYAPGDPSLAVADVIWLDDAGLAADAGDTRHASALLSRLTLTYALMRAKLDSRFGAQVAADPARFDLKAAALRQLEHDRANMAAHPDHLADVHAVAADLVGLERFDEALALVKSALDRIAKAPHDKPAFSDQDLWRPWLAESQTDALTGLGRFDEALQLQRASVRLAEDGLPSASRRATLASALNLLGRNDEALATLRPFDKGVPGDAVGEAWVRAERACANQALGRAGQVGPELAWLAEHRREATGARLRALICAGAANDIAAELIAELTDPDQRETALVRLSPFDPPNAATPVMTARLATLNAVRARPDIRAAVAAVGHTEPLPLNARAYVDAF